MEKTYTIKLTFKQYNVLFDLVEYWLDANPDWETYPTPNRKFAEHVIELQQVILKPEVTD